MSGLWLSNFMMAPAGIATDPLLRIHASDSCNSEALAWQCGASIARLAWQGEGAPDIVELMSDLLAYKGCPGGASGSRGFSWRSDSGRPPPCRRPSPGRRSPGWRAMLALAAINFLLSPLVVLPLTALAAGHALAWRPVWWQGWPGLALDLLLLDFLIYWWHRGQSPMAVPLALPSRPSPRPDPRFDQRAALSFRRGADLGGGAGRRDPAAGLSARCRSSPSRPCC